MAYIRFRNIPLANILLFAVSGRLFVHLTHMYRIIQLLTYVEVDMECYYTVNVILTDAERRSI